MSIPTCFKPWIAAAATLAALYLIFAQFGLGFLPGWAATPVSAVLVVWAMGFMLSFPIIATAVKMYKLDTRKTPNQNTGLKRLE